MTRDQSDKLFRLSMAAFPHLRVTDDGLNAAWAVLRIYEYGECAKALVRLMREARKFPATPGEIVSEMRRKRTEAARMERGIVPELKDPRPTSDQARRDAIHKFLELFDSQPPEVRARLGIVVK